MPIWRIERQKILVKGFWKNFLKILAVRLHLGHLVAKKSLPKATFLQLFVVFRTAVLGPG